MHKLIMAKMNGESRDGSPERAHHLVIGSTAMGMSGGAATSGLSDWERERLLLPTARSARFTRQAAIKASSRATPPVRVDDHVSLPSALFADAAELISNEVGAELTQTAIARILSESRIGAKILYFDEVETEIRSDMSRAVAQFFTGEDWPVSRTEADRCAYGMRLRATARARGYLLHD